MDRRRLLPEGPLGQHDMWTGRREHDPGDMSSRVALDYMFLSRLTRGTGSELDQYPGLHEAVATDQGCVGNDQTVALRLE